MLVYLYNILSLPIYNILFKNKKIFCFVVSVQLFIILAIRDISVGADLFVYQQRFEQIKNQSFAYIFSSWSWIKSMDEYAFEYGYVLLNKIVSFLGLNFRGLLIICAFININSIGTFIYKYSTNPLISFVIYISFNMYSYSFSALRQSLAFSICLYMVPFLIENKKIKAAIILAVAIMFHRAALVAIPLLFVSKIKIDKKRLRTIALLLIVMFLLIPMVLEKIVVPFMSEIGLKGHTQMEFQTNNLIVFMIAIVIAIYFLANFNNFDDKILNLSLWGVILAIAVEFFGMYNDTVARSVEIVWVYIILLIPNLIQKCHNIKLKTCSNFMIYIFMTAFMIYTYNGSLEIVPYLIMGNA